MAAKKIVDWDAYCEMSEEDRSHVTVVTFTGLTDLTTAGTLREAPSASEGQGTLGSGGREHKE